MIRQQRDEDFVLITQDDHAHLAGRLAGHLGNADFAPPDPRDATLLGISLHDSGWPLHDEVPTLDRKGLPLHVLESPMSIATRVWAASAERAAAADLYAGLLVSLHVMNLSAIAYRNDAAPHERMERRHDLFLLNQFQQDQIELQETLRRRLGLRTDLPLRLGLAKGGADAQEDRLAFNYNWLKLMDRLSLEACCGKPLFPTIDGVFPRPGGEPVEFRLDHPRAGHLVLTPWPFDVESIELSIRGRRLPADPFKSESDFRLAYAAAAEEAFSISIRPAP